MMPESRLINNKVSAHKFPMLTQVDEALPETPWRLVLLILIEILGPVHKSAARSRAIRFEVGLTQARSPITQFELIVRIECRFYSTVIFQALIFDLSPSCLSAGVSRS